MAGELSYLYELQKGVCFWCGKLMLPVGSGDDNPLAPSIDHVVPKGAGGVSTRAACIGCNRLRNTFNRTVYEQQRQKQAREIYGLKKLVVEQEKTIKRLTDIVLTHVENPWYKRLWRDICMFYWGMEEPESESGVGSLQGCDPKGGCQQSLESSGLGDAA